MKNFRVKAWFTWTARKSGGLFLGVRLEFPTSILDWTSDKTRTQVSVAFGFVFFTLNVAFSKWMQ